MRRKWVHVSTSFPVAGPAAASGAPAPAPSAGLRHERKYLVSLGDAERIGDVLRRWMPPDTHAPQGAGTAYTVRSLYFDSADLACYRAKVDGIARRHKVRLRAYGDRIGPRVRLEFKERHGALYRKRRAWLTPGDLGLLRDREPLGGPLVDPGADPLHRLRYLMEHRGYAPSLLVAYEREAYTEGSGDDTVRVTLDRRVRARAYPDIDDLYADDGFAPVVDHAAILEVRFTDVVPRALRALAARFELQRRACSKYAVSVARVMGTGVRHEGGRDRVRGR